MNKVKERGYIMKIAIGNDHAAVEMKNEIKAYLESKGHEVINFGTDTSASCNYADYGKAVGKAVASGEVDGGVLICGTGVGISLAANKVKGIRCAKVDSVEDAKLSRNDNGANIITFSYTKSFSKIKRIVKAFIEAETLIDERHIRRVNKISEYERSN